MNLTHMNYLLALAEEQSFSRAAEKLFISQPALSKALKSVEEELGLHLFVREKRRAYPTPAGEIYLKYASEIRQLQDRTREELFSIGTEPEENIKIGVNRLLAFGKYSDTIIRFTREYAGKIPDVLIMDPIYAIEELRRGKVDVAVAISSADPGLGGDLSSIRLYEEELAVLVPETGEFDTLLRTGSRKGSIPVRMLQGVRAISVVNRGNFAHMVRNYLSQHGVSPDFKYELSNQLLASDAVNSGMGVCFVHRSIFEGNKTGRLFALDPPFRYFHYFCSRKGEPLTAQAEAFLKILLDQKEEKA